MGFQSPQFDFIDQRFNHNRIKTLEVICTQEVQANLTSPVRVPTSNISFGPILDPTTGQLAIGNRIVVTDIDAGVGISPNKVCNVFTVTWQIVNATGDILFGPTTSIITDAIDCPGAGVGASQTVVQKHDIQVNFCVIPVELDITDLSVFFVSISIDYCLVVANEEVLKINTARPFCP